MRNIGKMVDMANDAEPKDKPETAIADIALPRYPWGLCIRLDEKQLEKLDIETGDAEVGDTIHLFALAKVTSISSSEREGGESSKCVELQITHLATESEDEENRMSDDERAERRYKSKDG